MNFRRDGGRSLFWSLVSCVLFITAEALPTSDVKDVPAFALNVVSDAADAIVKQSGWNKDSLKISSVDMKDAKLGESVLYEFDIEVGDVLLPLRLREEVESWRFLEEVMGSNAKDKGSGSNPVEVWQPEHLPAVLKPFELAGPVNLWIHNAKELRLAMPDDVDAGVVKRVTIADGAAVTVEGAREVSLTRPLQLPLPLVRGSKDSGLATSLLHLAGRLRDASRSEDKPLLSLRVDGPSVLIAAPSKESEVSSPGLKVKRLAPGSVELVSRNEGHPIVDSKLRDQSLSLSAPAMWPLAKLNGSNSQLVILEQAIVGFLGRRAYQRGSINLLRAKASVAEFVKLPFELEMEVNNETLNPAWPEWAAKPTVERLPFEVFAKVEGNKLLAMNVRALESVIPIDSFSGDIFAPNASAGNFPAYLGHIGPMTL